MNKLKTIQKNDLPSGWRVVELGDVALIKGGKRLPKGHMLQSSRTKHPYIRVRDLKERNISLDNLEYILDNTFKKISRYIVNTDDLLISTVGTIGRISIINKKLDGASQTENCAKISNLNKYDGLFLYYFLTSSFGQQKIYAVTVGAVQKKLPLHSIKKLQINWTTKKNRKAIAHILGKLDDKIELNRQINQTLETIAQTLFKSWFVDFDPVIDNAIKAGNPIPTPLKPQASKRKTTKSTLPKTTQTLFPNNFIFNEKLKKWIPEGWEVDALGIYIDVKRGGSPRPIHDFLAPKGLPWVKISDATSSNSRFLIETKQFIKHKGLKMTTLLKKGTLILSNSATPGLPKFLNLDACIHDGWLHFPKKKLFTDIYLYQLFLVIRKELLMQGNGSVFTNLKTDILKNHITIIPKTNILRHFNNNIEVLHNKIHYVQSEIKTLTKLRDTLLPKLISGKIRVNKI